MIIKEFKDLIPECADDFELEIVDGHVTDYVYPIEHIIVSMLNKKVIIKIGA